MFNGKYFYFLTGKQASLAADFSITQFSYVCRLLLVHGRYCYKRSCALSQFVMHRGLLGFLGVLLISALSNFFLEHCLLDITDGFVGLIISTMQAVFSCVFYFASVSLYQGLLMVW